MERWVIDSTISVQNFVRNDPREGCLRAYLVFGAKEEKEKKNTKKIQQLSGAHIWKTTEVILFKFGM